jgi:membrane fusion protein (multidrug efflux system)
LNLGIKIMNNKLSGLLGLLILFAGGAGLYVLSRQAPSGEEESEPTIETVVPVEVAQIRRQTLHDYLWAYGSVVPNPGIAGVAPAGANIRAPLDGIVTEVCCAVGQRVPKGQVLFCLYDRLAKAAVDQAQTTLTFAQENWRRQDHLKQIDGTSARLYLEAQQQLDAAQNALGRAEAELELLKVAAPFDGTIVELCVTAGETVGQADTLARLTDMTRLAVKAGVPTPQAHKLQLGQQAQIEASGSAASYDSTAAPLTSRVDYIDCLADPNNDTVPVLIGLPADTSLRPGRFVRVRITVGEYNDRLTVPNESIVTTPEGQTILAVVQADEAVLTPVHCGVREGDWVEVGGQGLEPGMTVVTVGAYGLPGKTKIRVMGQ